MRSGTSLACGATAGPAGGGATLRAAALRAAALLRITFLGAALLGVVSLPAPAARAGTPAPPAAVLRFDPARMIGVDELRPGMTGVARTVFHGDSIEEFAVEVLSVIRHASSDGDIILVRCRGEKVEHTGVAAGMSGSPVYFGGRLAGAIALGWPFSKDPVAGVTPIAQMIEATTVTDAARRIELDPGPAQPGRRGTPAPLWYGLRARSAAAAALAESLLSGLGAAAVDVMTFAPAAGEAAAGDRLLPGAAVGISLASGDLDLTAVGTVTLRQGDQVLCFGHPLFSAGSVSLPLTTAYIHTVLSSQYSSTKMASAGAVVGALTEDRAYAVRGTVGATADQVPVRLTVLDDNGSRHLFGYRVMRHHALTASLVAMTVADGIGSQAGGLPRLSVPYRATVHFSGGRVLRWEDQPAAFGGGGPVMEPARELASRLSLLLNNAWSEARVDSVSVEAEVRPGFFGAAVDGAWLTGGSAHPGERIHISVRLRPERGEPFVETLELQLPGFLPAGRYRLLVGDMDSRVEAERQRAPGMFRPATLDQALDLLRLRGTRAALYAQLYSDDTGVTTRGTELPALPGSTLADLQDGRPGGALLPVRSRRWAECVKPIARTLVGSADLVLNVEREEP
ncbi:MAG: hypothetical protein HZB25_05400 [Candidatus Eisenbacteria bacterium]|nr:hypothetical protein [Candidatus Eisenbacteria bacterium]